MDPSDRASFSPRSIDQTFRRARALRRAGSSSRRANVRSRSRFAPRSAGRLRRVRQPVESASRSRRGSGSSSRRDRRGPRLPTVAGLEVLLDRADARAGFTSRATASTKAGGSAARTSRDDLASEGTWHALDGELRDPLARDTAAHRSEPCGGIGPPGLESFVVDGAASVASTRPQPVVIRPPKRWVGFGLRELWRFRELLVFLAWRDLKVRYKQTILGVAWAVLQPLLYTLVATLLFKRLLGVYSAAGPTSSCARRLRLLAPVRERGHARVQQPRRQRVARDQGLLPAAARAARDDRRDRVDLALSTGLLLSSWPRYGSSRTRARLGRHPRVLVAAPPRSVSGRGSQR